MKVTNKERLHWGASRLIKSENIAGEACPAQRVETGASVESTNVNISRAARVRQKIAEPLNRKGDKVVTKRVRQIKEIIAKGEYEVDPREVAKSILRVEIPQHPEKRKVQSMNIDLTELLALRKKGNCGGGKNIGASRGIKSNRSQRETLPRFPNKSLQNQA